MKSPSKLGSIGLAAILLAAVTIYLGSLPKEYTNWDDPTYITENPLIRSLSLGTVNQILTRPYFSNYAPITLLSYLIDFHIFKLNANASHLLNVGIHLGCVLTLLLVLRTVGVAPEAALLTVALFACHPVNVEAVSWASERKTLLSALFFLMSFHFYVRYRQEQSRTSYLYSILFFLLSILSKASTIVAPVIYLAYDYGMKGERLRELKLYDKLPFLVPAEVLAFASVYAARSGNSLRSYHEGGSLVNLLGLGRLFWDYLGSLFFPFKLSAIYRSGAPLGWTDIGLWLSLVLAVLTIVSLGYLGRQVQFGVWWFAIFLIPVLNLVPLPVRMADRYLYLPQIGIWGITSHLILRSIRQLNKYRMLRAVWIGLLCLMGGVLWTSAFQYSRIWRTSFTLWTDVTEKNFKSSLAHCSLGEWFASQGQLNAAGLQFQIACELNPSFNYALRGLGRYYLAKGQLDLAEKYYRSAINAAPSSDAEIEGLGLVCAEKGAYQRALYMFYRATYVNPENPSAFCRIARFYLSTSQLSRADAVVRLIIAKFPQAPDGYWLLGRVLEEQGRLSDAVKAWEAGRGFAEGHDPDISRFDRKLAATYQKLHAHGTTNE